MGNNHTPGEKPRECISPLPERPREKTRAKKTKTEENNRDYACLKDELARNLRFNFFEDAEIEALLGGIEAFGEMSRKVAALCLQLSNTSSNLVERTLGHIRRARASLPEEELVAWLTRAFDLLDSSGLQQAVSFISKSDEADLESFKNKNKNPGAVKLESISARLELYLKGISGMDFRIQASGPKIEIKIENPCYTDSSAIYLPERLDVFCGVKENLLLYRLMAAHKWAQAAEGTLAPAFESPSPTEGQSPAMDAAKEASGPLERFFRPSRTGILPWTSIISLNP